MVGRPSTSLLPIDTSPKPELPSKGMSMSTRAPFLSTRYGGYYHRELPQEDAELTRIGPGTPCGEYLRRFWQPVCYSDDLQDLPVALKILSEELVAFKDFSGQIGVVEAHCPHRGTSLEFGLVSERGIRCCYHGSVSYTHLTLPTICSV